MATPSEIYFIGRGRLGGIHADSFWQINSEGKTGVTLSRFPSKEEISSMLGDLEKHRQKLLEDLAGLDKAEKLLKQQ